MIAAGQSIGNYRILSKLGTGGMGAVFLAEHPLIGKKVALKVIHRELAGNREVVQRFFQEARSVNQIGSPHIVEIHDFGQTPDGDHFYIMEYLEGTTLASQLAKHVALDVMRSLHIGAQIASALSDAHVAGIVHRDLKPDNIMLIKRLGDADFVKVLDFGLAKVFAAGASAVKTAHGVLLGTPQYMSPEACESKGGVDHRTDIYALGVLLFQMMTGSLPFDGESMGEVLVKQVTQLPPAPRGLNPSIPPSVEQVLLRCLAKPVGARFQSMHDLRAALLDPEAYLRSAPPIAPARSVAPGEARVDAKTVMAHAAMLQAQKEAAQAKTRIAEEAARVNLPALAPPAIPQNHTMRIGTPYGYTSTPPRRMWPVILGLGLILGLIGGASALVWCGGSEPVHEVASIIDASAQPGSAKPTKAAPAGSGSAIAKPGSNDAGSSTPPRVTVKLVIESKPSGASVYDDTGMLLGETPLDLGWPTSPTPVTFELRRAGYKKKVKQVVVDGEKTIELQLEREPERRPTPAPGRTGKLGNDLIRPE